MVKMGAGCKRENIEDVAFHLFLNKGYEATTVRMICRKARIDTPSLYNFYGSKKGLFFTVANKIFRTFTADVSSFSELLRSLPPAMQLYSIFSHNVDFTAGHIDESRFFIRYSMFCPEELKEGMHALKEDLNEERRSVISGILDECFRGGIIGVGPEEASGIFRKFLSNNCFDVVFEKWRPSNEELYDLWKMFHKCRLKGSLNYY
jgi:AcrR family transcriptional regulator